MSVGKTVHDLLKKRFDAMQEVMKRDSKDMLEKDSDWMALPAKAREEWFFFDSPEIANPGEQWTATDVIIDPHRPRRRLIFAGSSPSLWFIYYEHGGEGRHEHLLLIGKDATGGYWIRWVRNPHLGEKGISMTRLKRLAAAGRLTTSEEETEE